MRREGWEGKGEYDSDEINPKNPYKSRQKRRRKRKKNKVNLVYKNDYVYICERKFIFVTKIEN